MVLLGFFYPTFASPTLQGSVDVYLHEDAIDSMAGADSLGDFQLQTYAGEEPVGTPIGLYILGGTLERFSGAGPQLTSRIIVALLIVAVCATVLALASAVLRDRAAGFASVALFLGSPILTLVFFDVRHQNVGLVFLIMLFLLTALTERPLIRIAMFGTFSWVLALSHVGTYVGALFLLPAVFGAEALMRRWKWDWIVCIVMLYMALFLALASYPPLAGPYSTRSEISLFATLRILPGGVGELLNPLLEDLFFNKSPTAAAVWVLIVCGLIFLLAALRSAAARASARAFGVSATPALAILPGIPLPTSLSRDVLTGTLLLGPAQLLLTIGGGRKLLSVGLMRLSLPLLLVATLSISSRTGPGEYFKYFQFLPLVVCMTAALGMVRIMRGSAFSWVWPQLRALVLPLAIVSTMTTTFLGSYYYLPDISENLEEQQGLVWIGSSTGKDTIISSPVYFGSFRLESHRDYDKYQVPRVELSQYEANQIRLYSGSSTNLRYWESRWGVDRVVYVYSDKIQHLEGYPNRLAEAGLYETYKTPGFAVYAV